MKLIQKYQYILRHKELWYKLHKFTKKSFDEEDHDLLQCENINSKLLTLDMIKTSLLHNTIALNVKGALLFISNLSHFLR